jgi:DNA-binding NarL/FixJ family response regulator
MSRKIRIVIADDHPVFAQGLRQVLIADPYMDVVADARDGEAALQCIQEHKPDVAVLDVDMPKKDGFEVLRAVQERKLAVATIFLTMHKHESIFNAALDLGVAAGRNFVSPTLSTYLFGRRRHAQSLLEQQPALKDLSPSEQRVLRSIADAKTSDQIASELHVSIRTIEHHRANICAKLSLHGSNALLRFALAHKSELL